MSSDHRILIIISSYQYRHIHDTVWFKNLRFEYFVNPCGEDSEWVSWFQMLCATISRARAEPLTAPFFDDFKDYMLFLESLSDMLDDDMPEEDFAGTIDDIYAFRHFWAKAAADIPDKCLQAQNLSADMNDDSSSLEERLSRNCFEAS